jgi:hypothetical protein
VAVIELAAGICAKDQGKECGNQSAGSFHSMTLGEELPVYLIKFYSNESDPGGKTNDIMLYNVQKE